MTTKSIVQSLCVFALLLVATGCATVTRGSSDTLEVNSTPSGADIKIYRTNAGFNAKEIKNNTVANPRNPGAGPLIATTPASFKLARTGNYRVEVSKPGYKTVETEIGNRLAGSGAAGMAGNALAGGIIGVVIDSRTGATKDLTPNPVDIVLEKGSGTIFVPLNKDKSKVEEVVNESTDTIDQASSSVEGKIEEAIEDVVEAEPESK